MGDKAKKISPDKITPGKVSPQALQIIERLGEIRKQILHLVQPLRYKLTFHELCQLRKEGIITPVEFQLLINPLFDPFADPFA